MTSRILDPNRREVLVGLCASATSLGAPVASLGASATGLAAAPASPPVTAQLALQARPASLALRPDQPATSIWELAAVSAGGDVRLKRGDRCEVVFRNGLPVPLAPVWSGINAPVDRLSGRAPSAPDATETSIITIPNAGTLLADFRLFEDVLKQPARPLPIIVAETSPVATDRDMVLLIEEWRLRPDGTALPPGRDPKDTSALYTLNGKTSFDLSAAAGERLRLRFINGSQRSVLAIKLDHHEVQVMALDGQPAEPFPARNGALVLAPGARADAFVHAATSALFLLHDGKQARQVGSLTISGRQERSAPLLPPQPLPRNDLPETLALRSALRFDVALGASEVGWTRPVAFSTSGSPAFRTKIGRTVVLALKNPGSVTTVFHLHGQPFRLLDKLDDGWKPYWLDTLAIEPGQTQRIAFAAMSPGRWLIESVVTDWAAPRLVRWYAVE